MTTYTTPTNEYEALRSKINEMFPERLKLEFGCEVKDGSTFKHTIWRTYPPIKIGMEWRRGALTDVGQQEDITCWEILGKPLTIVDVLRALNTIDRKYEKERHIHFNARNTPFWVINSYGLLLQAQDPGTLAESLVPTTTKFDLSLPLSHPENAPACKAVLQLLEKK